MNDANYLYMNRIGHRNQEAGSEGCSRCVQDPGKRGEMERRDRRMPPSGIRPASEEMPGRSREEQPFGMRPWMGAGQRNMPCFAGNWAEQFPVGMGYVPMQNWQQTYSMEEAFQRGTIFPILDLPFVMGRCM